MYYLIFILTLTKTCDTCTYLLLLFSEYMCNKQGKCHNNSINNAICFLTTQNYGKNNKTETNEPVFNTAH